MSSKSLSKISNKYHCMVSGEKRMTPCSGCTNPKGCVSRTMQYKENTTMDQKAIVKIDADGAVTQCAKNLGPDKCGYKPGAKVCGACGAMAVMQKAADEEIDDAAETEEKGYGKKPKPFRGMAPDVEMDDEMEDDEMEDDEMDMPKMRMMARRRRMQSMGVKSDEFDDDSFVCAFERKVYPGSASVCENCPGGCAAEGNLPGLLDIEGTAEDMFRGKVLDSGYSDEVDLFVVDVERKDGKTIEAFFDGSSGECMGWHVLPDHALDEKSALSSMHDVITFDEAAAIATKTIQGDVIGVDPDIFEGFDSYAVEIEGLDGKSYDVYVGLDGEVLGYDEYEADEAEEIEAEAAEIALKRAYSQDDRDSMAKAGEALPDGSFPIKDEEDLLNAIQAHGRAKDIPKARAHIMKRAIALGMEEMIPEEWMKKSLEDDFDIEDDLAEFAEMELKRAYSEEARMDMAKRGHAMPDGSFPIKDEADLKNAIRAFGRAKDKNAAKAHIMKRALDLKLEDLIPMNWVPKKIQQEYADGKKDAADDFVASLMEFEILSAEVDIKDGDAI